MCLGHLHPQFPRQGLSLSTISMSLATSNTKILSYSIIEQYCRCQNCRSSRLAASDFRPVCNVGRHPLCRLCLDANPVKHLPGPAPTVVLSPFHHGLLGHTVDSDGSHNQRCRLVRHPLLSRCLRSGFLSCVPLPRKFHKNLYSAVGNLTFCYP